MELRDHLTLRLARLKPPEKWMASGSSMHFFFPRGGSGYVMYGNSQSRVLPGDVVAANGDSACRFVAEDKGELLFWNFSANLEHLYPLLSNSEISLLPTLSERFRTPKIFAASTPLATSCHRLLADAPPQSDLDHRSQLLRVVALVMGPEFKAERFQRNGLGRAEDHLIHVFERLTEQEILESSVNDLATRFGCSRRHLNRLFHQFFGISLAALRMEMRLLKAVSLLRDPEAKVIGVAEACGFNHLGLFNTCFKRRFGVSPGQWRKQSSPAPVVPAQPFSRQGECALRSNGLCPMTTNQADCTANRRSAPSPAKRKISMLAGMKVFGGNENMKAAASQVNIREALTNSPVLSVP